MTPQHGLSDEKRWIEASQKDVQGFEPLYNKYYGSIFRFILRRTGDEMLSSDLCSQTFFKALDGIKKYKWQGKPFGAWLFTIASNEIRKYYRDKKDLFVIDAEELGQALEVDINKVEKNKEILMRALEQLSDEEVRLIEMRFFESLPFADISDYLDKKESAIKMKLYRSIDKLRKIIKP